MSQVYNILVTNIDPQVTIEALTTFFSFTGNVIEVRISDCEDGTKSAIVSFDNEESVKTAELMTGATLENRRIQIVQTDLTHQDESETVFVGETLPQRTIPELPENHTKTSVAASLIARGYLLASDTFQKAVAFDKEHSITATLKAGVEVVKEKAIEVDEKLHITEYLALGAAYAKSVVTGIDEKYRVTEACSEFVAKADETLHLSESYEICKNVIDRGIETVKNSKPVLSLRESTSNFKREVQQEIDERQPQEIIVQEDVPFEVHEQQNELPVETPIQQNNDQIDLNESGNNLDIPQ
jgi:hypothetical protein